MTLIHNSPEATQSLTPVIETDVFISNPNAHYWLGAVASHGTEQVPNAFTAARVLRANTYIDEQNFLPADAREADGGESDADDARSTHYIAMQNEGHGFGRVVGNIRVIQKRNPDELLPVERMFPDAFLASPAPVNSVEASRFISRHPEKAARGPIAAALIRAVVLHANMADQKPVFATIEKPLERHFKMMGIPVERVAEPRPIEEYGDTINMAVRFDPAEIIAATDQDVDLKRMITSFFQHSRQNLGIGLYDQALMDPATDQVRS